MSIEHYYQILYTLDRVQFQFFSTLSKYVYERSKSVGVDEESARAHASNLNSQYEKDDANTKHKHIPHTPRKMHEIFY